MRRTWKAASFGVVVGSLGGVYGGVGTVDAYVTNGCRWSGTNIYVKNAGGISFYNGVTHNYQSYFNTAVSRWNGPVSDATWVMTPYTIKLSMENLNFGNNGKVGYSWWTCSGGTFDNYAVSSANEYYVWDETGSEIAGLMVHELGHTAGLSHPNDCTDKGGNKAIMKSSFGCGFFSPQNDDVAGIHAIY